ncbi:TMEM258 [Cordylochernes scorpioides]|uniref:Dolichyl-diphosphooligosaccharide-protein glycosyltransferase subunit TMEM258 n=1 Tax=Cordylochernes scorpioides TaxID=51811 RepID=A0ABY6L7Z4_9ARAC|nr:TMEM258 [Cordylochernes scorpioides]
MMTRHVSPVNPAVYPHLSLVLLAIGIFFMAWFFVYPSHIDACILHNTYYEVTSTKFTRDLFKELLISLVAAFFLGFGVLFLALWVGIYV